MKLSLSGRVVEKFQAKREASMGLGELADLAAAHGYRAVCMRASQLGIQTPAATVRSEGEGLRRRGLAVSMDSGDFPIPENSDDEGPQALRNITPYLDLAVALEADLLRICMKCEEDITWAQRAARLGTGRSASAVQKHWAQVNSNKKQTKPKKKKGKVQIPQNLVQTSKQPSPKRKPG